MSQKTAHGHESEKEKLDSITLAHYKWNCHALEHEFTLLHNRASHHVNVSAMMLAVYVPVLGISLAHLEDIHLRIFSCVIVVFASVLGVATSLLSISGIAEAETAILAYLEHLRQLEKRLGGKSHPFVRDTTLNRVPDADGRYRQHEDSLRFHGSLPHLMIVFWIGLLLIGVGQLIIPISAPDKLERGTTAPVAAVSDDASG